MWKRRMPTNDYFTLIMLHRLGLYCTPCAFYAFVVGRTRQSIAKAQAYVKAYNARSARRARCAQATECARREQQTCSALREKRKRRAAGTATWGSRTHRMLSVWWHFLHASLWVLGLWWMPPARPVFRGGIRQRGDVHIYVHWESSSV